jgi:hypothetical protein
VASSIVNPKGTVDVNLKKWCFLVRGFNLDLEIEFSKVNAFSSNQLYFCFSIVIESSVIFRPLEVVAAAGL